MKKSLTVLLALVLIVGSLAGCSGNNNSSKSESSKADSSKAESSKVESSQAAESSTAGEDHPWELLDPIDNTTGTLSVARSQYVEYPVADAGNIELDYWLPNANNIVNGRGTVQATDWAKNWQELTGIKAKFTSPTVGSEAEEFGVMTASSSLPDIVEWEWSTQYTGGPAAAKEEGILIILDEYISEYGAAADTWQFLKDNPHLDKQVKNDDGQYYTFPFVPGTKYLQCTSGPIIREDLFESVGVKAEDLVTIDDWYNALVKLRDAGVEYPLSTQKWDNLMSLVLTAWGVRPNMYRDYDTGEVKYGYAQEGYKQCIETLTKWVDEGLVDPSLLNNEKNTVTQRIMTGTSAITYGAGGGNLGTYIAEVNKAEAGTYAEGISFKAINFPVLNKGDVPHYAGASYDFATTSKGSAVITADCEYPEIAAKFLNFNYSKKGHYFMNYGIEGETWEWVGDEATYTDKVMDYEANGWANVAVAMANCGRANMSGPFAQDPNYIFQYYAEPAQKEALYTWNDNQDSQKTLIPPVTMTQEESSQYATLMADIDTFVKSSYGEWFNRSKNVADTWDSYISTLEGMGLADAVKLYQGAVDRYDAR